MAKIKKSDYSIIAAMREMGLTWTAIAHAYGVNRCTIYAHKPDIEKLLTEGGKGSVSSFGKAKLVKIALTSDNEDNQIKALKAFDLNADGEPEQDGYTTIEAVEQATQKVLDELRSGQ